MPDIRIETMGSVSVVYLQSAKAASWVEENEQDATFWGRLALVVEPRYVPDVLAAMSKSGLELRK